MTRHAALIPVLFALATSGWATSTTKVTPAVRLVTYVVHIVQYQPGDRWSFEDAQAPTPSADANKRSAAVHRATKAAYRSVSTPNADSNHYKHFLIYPGDYACQ